MSNHDHDLELPLTASPARSLAAALARRDGDRVELLIGECTAIPDARHVTVELAGVTRTVPRLVSYSPVVGDAVYLLAARTVVLALGGIR